MKKVILLLNFTFFVSVLFGQGQANFGDFEFKTNTFGKTTGIFVEGEQSIKVHLSGYAEVVFMIVDDRDLICQGTNGDLKCYDIKEVFKLNSYYHIKATYLKESEAIFYFDASNGYRDIIISYDNKQLLVMLESQPYNSKQYITCIPLFKYLDSKY